MLENIPGELRCLTQWVVADMRVNPETGLPTKLPLNPRTGEIASVIDPTSWGTFEEAIATGYKHIGFVLTQADPYCIIDLDNKPNNPATPEQLDRHNKILTAFDSYTERSVSGSGFHIIVRGAIPSGVHRDKVEVYSSGRYMICTGDVVRQSPILDYQPLLDILYGEMKPPEAATLVEIDAIMTDEELVNMAMNASNADKFNKLCRGEWQDEYPSQSEADFALLSIFTFYTQDNEQVRRLFRMTALGKRDKATKNNTYLNRALAKIRAAQPQPIDLSQLVANAANMMANIQGEKHETPQATDEPKISPPIEQISNPIQSLDFPPGIIGDLACYFLQTAIRPVKEIALCAAIALVAGVVGRSYNVSGTGLNHYLILLAKTGSGKEGAVSGIEKLISAVRPQIPMADQFIGPAAFASGQALIKVLNERPCFVSVLGEFGLTLQQLSDHNANSAQIMLRKVLLDLYAKSGWASSLRSSVYSDVEKNTKIIQAPNVTILGESTPETFYDGLDQSHIAEGLIPRFSIVEYNGPRPPRNRNANCPPSPQLVQRFSDLIAVAVTTTNNHTCCPVSIDQHALHLLDEFDTKADVIMNKSKHDVEMQLWNRSHLKALKLAALISVGINPHSPLITGEIAAWAISFVKGEVESVAKRFKDGDVGQGDSKQYHDLRRSIEQFFKNPPKAEMSNTIAAQMHAANIISYRHLAQRTACLASFRNDKMGSTIALKKNLMRMIDSGIILEIPTVTLMKNFQYSGVAYGIGKMWD